MEYTYKRSFPQHFLLKIILCFERSTTSVVTRAGVAPPNEQLKTENVNAGAKSQLLSKLHATP
jgi:hypothetical protein